LTLLTPWQTIVITLLYLYIARNLGKLVGLECPEPLANLYTRSYFRATWVTTALDAGFWTAMRLRRKWLRDLCSIFFSIYYLIAAEQADEKVRKVRGMLTLDHLRVSWNKGTTPYLAFASKLLRPRLMKYPPRAIRIPRPSNSDYKDPVSGWLYFDGPLSALKNHTKVVLDIPGGGFVAMNPRTNDDKLFAWAGKTGLPVLSLDYKKAPEFPYPYALNECYDVYHTLIASRGRCIGLSGEVVPKVVLTGDSAGGNLAAAVVLMIIQSGSTETRKIQGEVSLPIPDGLILIYPGLDLNISNWISDEKMSLIKDRRMRKLNKNMVRQKSMQYTHLVGTPHQSDDEDGDTPEKVKSPQTNSANDAALPSFTISSIPANQVPSMTEMTLNRRPSASHHSEPLQTRLAMSSMISYFNDRILSPEMMRSMIILYIGPHARPDFSTDYLLSPMLAPDSLLRKFPKTYFLTGERDPMVDDTVIFAGRLRRAKAELHEREAAQTGGRLRKEFDDKDVVEVALIPGISHGFLQFVGVFPEGWRHIFRCARWIDEIFAHAEEKEHDADIVLATPGYISSSAVDGRYHYRSRTESSGDEDHGLEMNMTKSKSSLGKAAGTTTSKGTAELLTEEKEKIRKEKEKLLKEHLDEKTEDRTRARDGDNRGRGRERDKPGRKKSLVSLASSDDLLSRRMLGLAGPLTGRGDG
jgi:acetyl esterase/lipase